MGDPGLIGSLLWLLAWSGAPVYLLTAVGQGMWLHSAGFGPAAIAVTAIFSFGLTLLAALVLWVRAFGGGEIMAWHLLNMPGTIAAVLVFIGVGALVRFGFSD